MIGLLGADRTWCALLRQEGVSFSRNVAEQPDVRVLVLDRRPQGTEMQAVKAHVEAGKAVLSSVSAAAAVWPELASRRSCRLRYVVPDSSPLFRNVGTIDLAGRGQTVVRANAGFLADGRQALYAGRIGSGWCVLLPFEIPAILSPGPGRPRVFHARTRRRVYETVAQVNRGEVRRLVANSLRFLLSQMDLPYVSRCHVPPPHTSSFGFRVDTDFDSVGAVRTVAKVAAAVGIRCSWFLHVSAHGSKLATLVHDPLKGNDLQLHCYNHRTYADYERELADLSQGYDRMVQAGARPVAAAAPYGVWNKAWHQAVIHLGLHYSSEFGIGYDDIPFRPLVDGEKGVLQVPVHPVSFARLLAARAGTAELVRYFKRQVDIQAQRSEPCFLYGHPGPLARHSGQLQEVIEYGIARCGTWTTMTDYAEWWMRRERAEHRTKLGTEDIGIAVQAEDDALGFAVEKDGRRSVLPFRSQTVRLGQLAWRELPAPVRFSQPELRRSGPDWRIRAGEFVRGWRRRAQAIKRG